MAKHIAVKQLYEALVSETVVAISNNYVVKTFHEDGHISTDSPISVTLTGNNWRALADVKPGMPPHVPVDWYNNQWFHSTVPGYQYDDTKLISYEARDIKVFASQLKALWSPIKPEQISNRNRGGRPEEHNWPAVFAYCGWWVSKNGLPNTKQRLVEIASKWFETVDAGVPKDDKALRDRVSRAYDELARLTGEDRGGV